VLQQQPLTGFPSILSLELRRKRNQNFRICQTRRRSGRWRNCLCCSRDLRRLEHCLKIKIPYGRPSNLANLVSDNGIYCLIASVPGEPRPLVSIYFVFFLFSGIQSIIPVVMLSLLRRSSSCHTFSLLVLTEPFRHQLNGMFNQDNFCTVNSNTLVPRSRMRTALSLNVIFFYDLLKATRQFTYYSDIYNR